jgi:hypothetical protein
MKITVLSDMPPCNFSITNVPEEPATFIFRVLSTEYRHWGPTYSHSKYSNHYWVYCKSLMLPGPFREPCPNARTFLTEALLILTASILKEA